jgi:chemotaxis protein methyltransferase CheR
MLAAVPKSLPWELDRGTFQRIREIVYRASGIVLNDDKATLVAGRLGRRMRDLGFNTPRDYLSHLERDRSGAELTQLLDAMSTNVTSFFREADHFEFIRQLYARWLKAGQRRFRVWSAAASSGEEPYTLSMSLLEQGADPRIDLRILATDISTAILSRAIDGVYAERAVEQIPRALLSRYFKRELSDANEEANYVATDVLKQPLIFRHLNLAELPFRLRGPLDLILCRNVMIYFDTGLRAKLVAEFARLLKPGGCLIVSHSESLVGIESNLKMVRPSVYLKPNPVPSSG